ncbi:hypothetical protein [Bacillus sp. AFS017274]|uniref:hypothetical protein n=1 Tax=Bacillus sp. AFS017274 TaxID=2033488 RepID=UPI000BFA457D|nr:hypothetical protein [Bacillus sp. AFS017274]PEZ78886.1 hypothetical protein CN380_18065 [Bacillus sp. AFS017274]
MKSDLSILICSVINKYIQGNHYNGKNDQASLIEFIGTVSFLVYLSAETYQLLQRMKIHLRHMEVAIAPSQKILRLFPFTFLLLLHNLLTASSKIIRILFKYNESLLGILPTGTLLDSSYRHLGVHKGTEIHNHELLRLKLWIYANELSFFLHRVKIFSY